MRLFLYQSSIIFQILDLIYGVIANFIFDGVTVKTSKVVHWSHLLNCSLSCLRSCSFFYSSHQTCYIRSTSTLNNKLSNDIMWEIWASRFTVNLCVSKAVWKYTTTSHPFILYLHKSHNTPLLPPKNLHRHCFKLLLGHVYVPGEIANNEYAKFFGS